MSTQVRSCPRCGSLTGSNWTFCQWCGANLLGQVTPGRSNRVMIIAIVVIVIAGVAVIGTALSILPTAHHSKVLWNGLLTSPAHSYTSVGFSVPSHSTWINVNGTFTAFGGGGNVIDVFVVDQANFANWSYGRQASFYYDSGRVTTGTVIASLPGGGDYVIVYSNTFSVSNQTVWTNVDLAYYY